jgi:hypothetical protein
LDCVNECPLGCLTMMVLWYDWLFGLLKCSRLSVDMRMNWNELWFLLCLFDMAIGYLGMVLYFILFKNGTFGWMNHTGFIVFWIIMMFWLDICGGCIICVVFSGVTYFIGDIFILWLCYLIWVISVWGRIYNFDIFWWYLYSFD